MTSIMPSGEIHPHAALLPLLPDDELHELAEDIRENGLRYPIVLDQQGTLVDGRNRLAACRLAGVEPRYTVTEDDPTAYIRSTNIRRRNISLGTQAMWEVETGVLPQNTMREQAALMNISPSRLAYAVVVHRFGHDAGLCDKVLAGGSLDDAYRHAQDLKRKRDETKRAAEDAARAAREAESRQERLALEEAEALAALRLAFEEIGPSVPIPSPPELASNSTTPRADRDLAPRLNNVTAEQAYARKLAAVKREIAALAELPVEQSAMPALSLAATRSWASQVVTLVYGIVDAHNRAYGEEQGLRMVK